MYVTFEIIAGGGEPLDELIQTIQDGTSITAKKLEHLEQTAGRSKFLGMGAEASIILKVTFKCDDQEEVNRIRANLEEQAKQPIAVSVSFSTVQK